MSLNTSPFPKPIFLQSAILAFLFLCLSAGAYTQAPATTATRSSGKTTASPPSMDSITIRLTNSDSLPAARRENLFRHFEVMDERTDTTRIGIHSGFKGFRSSNKQLVFRHSAREEVASYLNTHYARPDAPFTALIVFRHIWLSDANYIHEDLIKDPDKSQDRTRIRIKAEVYAVSDSGYRPIFRYDSTNTSEKNSYAVWGNNLAEMLGDLADSASFLTAQKNGQGRFIRLEDIQQYNQSRFSFPIITDSPLTRGVYASFEEFKTNAPSIRDFEIKKEKNKLLLYVKEAGGNTYYSHKAWGYCDGKDIFVMKDGYLRPAWKTGKAFYFFSEAESKAPDIYPYSNSYNNYNNPLPPGSTAPIVNPGAGIVGSMVIGGAMGPMTRKHNSDIRIFTVDMDTGDVY